MMSNKAKDFAEALMVDSYVAENPGDPADLALAKKILRGEIKKDEERGENTARRIIAKEMSKPAGKFNPKDYQLPRRHSPEGIAKKIRFWEGVRTACTALAIFFFSMFFLSLLLALFL